MLVLLGLAACGGGPAVNQSEDAGAATTPPVEPVRSTGGVMAEAVVVPVQSAALSLPSGGTVAEVLVKEGEQVQAGQVLLRLDAARQRAAVAQAEAGLSRAQARLDELKAGARSQEVAAAEAALQAAQAGLQKLQAGTKPEDIQAAEAGLSAAQAALQKVQEGPDENERIAASAELDNAAAAVRQAQAAYDRVKGDADIGARPESLALEQATAAYNAARARLEALDRRVTQADISGAQARVREAQARLDALRAPARAADIAAAEAEVRRAQAQRDLVKDPARPETILAAEADVTAAQATLDQAKAALAETELRAPFAGTVAQLDLSAGEQATPGAPIAQLADLSQWKIETDDLTELDIVQVTEGKKVNVTFDAIPGLELVGTVEFIKPIGVNKQGDMTYTVVIVPEKTDPRLRWNMTATVAMD